MLAELEGTTSHVMYARLMFAYHPPQPVWDIGASALHCTAAVDTLSIWHFLLLHYPKPNNKKMQRREPDTLRGLV
ncbi:hypothetical protein QQP08_001733 [Theobroma cacao]|nr:hypothetical protein QQP08_001733 [Theobroma cacao]